MIAPVKHLKKFCKLYHLVENYIEARFDKDNVWHLHHRREIDECKSKRDLIAEGRYYDVEPRELIFLTKSDHRKLHSTNKNEEWRKKLSNANIGEKSGMFGKTLSEDTKKKISNANSGKKRTDEAKKKMSNAKSGEKNPMFGKTHTKEVRQKISKAHKGKLLSEEHKRPIGDVRKGNTGTTTALKTLWRIRAQKVSLQENLKKFK